MVFRIVASWIEIGFVLARMGFRETVGRYRFQRLLGNGEASEQKEPELPIEFE